MKRMNTIWIALALMLTACGGDDPSPITPKPDVEVKWEITPATTQFSAKGEIKNIVVTANGDWTATSGQSWCSLTPDKGGNGQTLVKISATANPKEEVRNAEITFTSGKYSQKYTVSQDAGTIGNYVPTGYNLVWAEEFDAARLSSGKPALPDTQKWWYENLPKGTVNNELQTYVGGFRGTDTVAAIHDGTLKIIARKSGTDIISARINTIESWTYGYFEARLRVPGGKGTWPAFWMLPEKEQLNWPLDGEIDIMEYVGYDPGWIHASVHTKAYNHTIGTQKTARKEVKTAETAFHIYAVEWTADYIKGFVDGVEYFRFNNDGAGNKETWPFNVPFYLKLNLAWGGNWGGAQSVDESKLPATYEIDYVRVYQKK
ncbi:GHF16 protein [Petrimonas sp. IBARAKI]|nr:GHF16 protein [Petrimonas sp. IBARAKI]